MEQVETKYGYELRRNGELISINNKKLTKKDVAQADKLLGERDSARQLMRKARKQVKARAADKRQNRRRVARV